MEARRIFALAGVPLLTILFSVHVFSWYPHHSVPLSHTHLKSISRKPPQKYPCFFRVEKLYLPMLMNWVINGLLGKECDRAVYILLDIIYSKPDWGKIWYFQAIGLVHFKLQQSFYTSICLWFSTSCANNSGVTNFAKMSCLHTFVSVTRSICTESNVSVEDNLMVVTLTAYSK